MAEGPKQDSETSSDASASEATSTSEASTGTTTAEAPSKDKSIATTTSGDATASKPATTGTDEKPAPGKRTLTPGKDKSNRSTSGGKDGGPSRMAKGGKAVKKGSDLIRSRIASIVWLIAVLAAVVLAVGALLYALDANMKNDIVKGVLDTARKIDGPFWRIFEFHQDTKGPGQGPPDQTKDHLVNWGLAAVAYLVAGRILDRVIRP